MYELSTVADDATEWIDLSEASALVIEAYWSAQTLSAPGALTLQTSPDGENGVIAFSNSDLPWRGDGPVIADDTAGAALLVIEGPLPSFARIAQVGAEGGASDHVQVKITKRWT